MRVWQPGTHLSSIKKVEVDDWSWRRTRRRIAELARLAKPYKVRTAFSVVSLLAATATALAPPFLAKYAVDDGIRRHDLGKLWWIVGAFVLAGLLNWAMSYVQTYLTGWVGERILADLRIVLFRHLQRLSLGFYERTRAGVIISRLTNDVEAIDQLVTDGVTSLVQNSLTLIGTAILLFVLDWRLALATLAVIPLMGIATVIFRTRSTRAYRAVRERLGLVTATLAEDIAGMRVVQAFTRESANTRNFKAVTERYRDSNMETVVLNALYFPFVDLLSSIALAVVLGYGGHLYFNGDVTLGTLFAFMLYVQNFFDQSSSCRSCTTRSSRRRRRSTRSWTSWKRNRRFSTGRARRPCPTSRAALSSIGFASATARGRMCCTSSIWTSLPERPSHSSGIRAPASPRSPSCSPGSTTRATVASRSTATTCAT